MDLVPCIHCRSEDHSGNQHLELFGEPEPSKVPVKGTVSIEDSVRTNEESADYGAYTTYVVADTDSPIRILGYDEKRSRATLYIDGTLTAPNSVWIGKQEQIYAAGGAQGALLTSGQPMVIRNKQEVWLAPNNMSCNVSVVNERWE